jgi:lipid-binding SYLF domain-containing protein
MTIRNTLAVIFALLAFSSPAIASEPADDKEAVNAFMESDVVKKFHNSAYGYAVFPTIGKGGLGIGAAHGSGGVYRGGAKTGDVKMTQVSFGLQAGGQAYRQIIYFQDKRAFDEFTSGEFEFSAQAEAIAVTASASAQAGTEGASASAGANQAGTKYEKGMIVFTMGKGGLMYQAALGGQKYSYTPSK